MIWWLQRAASHGSGVSVAKEPLAGWGVTWMCAGMGTAGIFGRAETELRQATRWVKMQFSSNKLHFKWFLQRSGRVFLFWTVYKEYIMLLWVWFLWEILRCDKLCACLPSCTSGSTAGAGYSHFLAQILPSESEQDFVLPSIGWLNPGDFKPSETGRIGDVKFWIDQLVFYRKFSYIIV